MTETVRATAADAEIILKLYELRREEVMRNARSFVVTEFWPQTLEDLTRVTSGLGTTENQYFRQVMSYWEMAAALVLRGALHEELFDDASAELYFIYAKFKRFIQPYREATGNQEFMSSFEKIVNHSPEGRKRIERMEKTIAQRMMAVTGKAVH